MGWKPRPSAISINTFGNWTAPVCLLAGIIRSPGYYCPFKNPENALDRRTFVFDKMVENNYITAEEAALAQQAPLGVESQGSRGRNAPFFVDHIIQELTTKQNLLTEEDFYTQGYRIYTTLDLHASLR